MKKVFVVCIALLMGITSASAQDEIDRGIFNHLGVNVSASTEGIGVGVAAPITDYLKRRVGFRFEAGCQFMGKMEVYQNDKLVDIRQYKNTDDNLSKFIDKWSIYPVLKLTITGRIL